MAVAAAAAAAAAAEEVATEDDDDEVGIPLPMGPAETDTAGVATVTPAEELTTAA